VNTLRIDCDKTGDAENWGTTRYNPHPFLDMRKQLQHHTLKTRRNFTVKMLV
jgi:hypothetical protein